MSQTENPSTPPPLEDLLTAYLRRQTAAHAAGLAAADSGGEVVPFDAAPADPVDPRLAWAGATAVLDWLGIHGDVPPPAEWPALVAALEPLAVPAFAAGNFPQMLRYLNPLLEGRQLISLVAAPIQSGSLPGLADWVREVRQAKSAAATLLAAGVLRLAGQFEAAEDLLRSRRPSRRQAAAWANEEAALAWHRGRTSEAATLWQQQADSPPVLFNRGLAALFLDRPAEAHRLLRQAQTALPQESSWHDLAGLFAVLAELRQAPADERAE